MKQLAEKRNDLREKTKKTAACAILSALAVTLLFVGGIIEILDMTASAIASAVIIVAYAEFGTKRALAVYAASSVLAFILFPMSGSVLYFAVVFGYYPVFKFAVDRKFRTKKLIRMLLKFAVFNAACTATILIFIKLYGINSLVAEFSGTGLSAHAVILILYVVLNIFFLMYDLLIMYVAVIYKNVLRKRIFPKK